MSNKRPIYYINDQSIPLDNKMFSQYLENLSLKLSNIKDKQNRIIEFRVRIEIEEY